MITVLLGTAISPVAATAKQATTCSSIEVSLGNCVPVTPSTGNGGVSLGGTVTLPGSGAGANPGTGSGSPGDGPREPPKLVLINGEWCVPDPVSTRICRSDFTVTPILEGRGPVILADLVNFAPTVSGHYMEPAGWMVVGLDTNFYVDVSTHIENDLLLGIPASVRFTPIGYRWNYGDGGSARLTTPGASWAELGVGEFDPTATSHVFRNAGTFAIDASVDFSAEYRFGQAAGAWIPIAGTVSIPIARLTATAQDATTVLVTSDCQKKPTAPGC